MNPNDYLAGVNIVIAVAWLMWGLLFVFTMLSEERRPKGKLGRVFLVVMGAICLFTTLDYGTTGALRVIDVVAFPGVPHSLLPDFSLFPTGITLLLIWRTITATLLWGLWLWMVFWMGGVDDADK